LVQCEASAAHSHDLAREGETDAASLLLGGEERDEDVGGDVVGDKSFGSTLSATS